MKLLEDDRSYFILSIGILALTGFIAIPTLTRLLSTEQFGHVALVLMIFNAIGILDGVKPIVINHYHRKLNGQPFEEYYITLSTLSILTSTLFAGLFTLAIAFCFPQLSISELLCILGGAFTLLYGSLFWGILSAENRPGFAYFLRSIIWSSIYLVLITFAWFEVNLHYYAIALAMMNVILLWLYKICTKQAFAFDCIDSQIYRDLAKSFKKILSFNFYRAFIDFFDRVIVAKIMSASLFGIYFLHADLALKGNLLSQCAAQYIYPKLCEQHGRFGITSTFQTFLTFSIAFILFMYFATFFGAFFSKQIISIYAGGTYSTYSNLFILLMLAIFYNTLSFLGITFQRAVNDFDSHKDAYRICVILGMIIVYPALKYFGLYGAVMIFICLRLSGVFIMEKICREYANDKKYYASALIISLATLSYLLLFVSKVAACMTFLLVSSLLAVPLIHYRTMNITKQGEMAAE